MNNLQLPLGVEITPLLPSDLAAVMALENASFSDPWSERAMRECLSMPVVRALSARRKEELLGFVIAYLIPPEGEVADICVAPSARGLGIGKALLQEIIDTSDCTEFFLEVRASNAPAIGLYRKLGFVPLGVRKRYYENPREDALVMGLALAGEKGE